MANSLSNIAESLDIFAAEVMYQLKKRLRLQGFVNRNYDPAPGVPGATIKIPDLTVAGDAAVRSIGGAATASDVSAQYTDVTLQHIYKAVSFDNIRRVFASVDLMTEAAGRVAYSVARKVDGLIVDNWSRIPYFVGEVDGTGAFNATDKLQALNLARKQLMQNASRMDQLQALFGPSEAANLRALDVYIQANQNVNAALLRDGELGRLFGFDLREAQDLPSNALATATQWGTPLVNGTPAIGDDTLPIDGAGSSVTIPEGSVFSLEGHKYTVTADTVTAATTGAATLPIWPPLKTAPADNTALDETAFSGTQGISLAWHPDAFVLAVRPVEQFIEGSGVASRIITDVDAGLSMRLSVESNVLGSAGNAFREAITIDMIAGAGLVRPEMAVRIHGEA